MKEKVESYLDGQLNQKERIAFELAMQKDPELAKQVAIAQEVNDTLSSEKRFKVYQKTIAALGNQYFKKRNKTETIETVRQLGINRKRRWLLAASVLIVVLSSILIWNVLKTESINSAEVFAANYEPYNVGQRGENDNLTTLEKEAAKAYNIGNYEFAIPLLQQLAAINTENEEVLLQLGSAYNSTDQAKKAIVVYQKIPVSSMNYQVAQWYLALAYLQDNQVEKAKARLTDLAKLGNRTFPRKAKEILEKLSD